MGSRPTLHDVAKTANVSISTVSKVLHHTGSISARTQRIVFEAVKRTGYRKSHSIFQKIGHSGLVGLITSDYNGRFSLPLLVGAENALGASNHAALLMISQRRPALEERHIDQLAARGVDGLIVVGDTTNPRSPLDASATMGLPVVYTYDPSSDPTDCSIVCDNTGAGSQAIEYFLSLGRKNIAVIAGADDFQATRDRVRGALRALKYYGGKPMDVMFDSWSEEWGQKAANLLMSRHPDVDAVYCLSDEIARGAIRGIMESGRQVPQDVAVIGHDDWFVFSTNSHPTLTTFDNNMELIGKTAARFLLDAIAGKPHHGITDVECQIIIRESTEISSYTELAGSEIVSSRHIA